MAKAKYKYKDINQVMRGIRRQVIDSVEYCFNNIPTMENPQELFTYLKQRVNFKHDPPGTELLQTAQTLFDDNKHGLSGYGDCDCFTILATAAFISQGWGDIDIVLAGRSKSVPVHIYNYITHDGSRYCFDLTEPYFNMERTYPLKQILPIRFYS